MQIFISVLTGVGFVIVLCLAGIARAVYAIPRPAEGGVVAWDIGSLHNSFLLSPVFLTFVLAAFVTGCLWYWIFSVR